MPGTRRCGRGMFAADTARRTRRVEKVAEVVVPLLQRDARHRLGLASLRAPACFPESAHARARDRDRVVPASQRQLLLTPPEETAVLMEAPHVDV